jgi:hypothetical protein
VLLYLLLELMARNIPVNRNMFSIGATSIARSACKEQAVFRKGLYISNML